MSLLKDKYFAPLGVRYDTSLFLEKDNSELSGLYGVNKDTIAKARKRLGIKTFKQIQEEKFLNYLKSKIEQQQIAEISLVEIRSEFDFKILKNHILRIIQNNNLDIHFLEFPKDYKFVHSSRGYRNFGCRCSICVNANNKVCVLRKIRLYNQEEGLNI